MDALDVVVRSRRVSRAVTGLLAAILVAGCGGSATTPGPSSSPAQTISAGAAATPSATAAAFASHTAPPSASSPISARATPAPIVLALDSLAVTIADRVVVRSKPRVANDSTIYSPSLPTGTELYVMAGPVDASGYRWYDVAPLTATLAGGVKHGWVAVASRDGAPWVRLVVGPPTPTNVTFTDEVGEETEEGYKVTQTVTWGGPRTAGVEIRVYGVTECLAEPAHAKPDTAGPCLVADTPLPTSVLRLLGSAAASRGVVTWTWMDPGGCDIGDGFGDPTEGPTFAVVVAAYGSSGHSTLAVAAPGEWWEPPEGAMAC